MSNNDFTQIIESNCDELKNEISTEFESQLDDCSDEDIPDSVSSKIDEQAEEMVQRVLTEFQSEEPSFKNEISHLNPGWGENLRKLANYKLLALIAGVGLFILIFSPYYLGKDLSQVLFVVASVQAAIAFYIFSIGNTMYTLAESMGEQCPIRHGKTVNANATLVILSAGVLIAVGTANAITWPQIFSGFPDKPISLIGILISVFVFMSAMLSHADYHRWRGFEDENGRLQALQGKVENNSSPDDLLSEINKISKEIESLDNSIDDISGDDSADLSEIKSILHKLENYDAEESDK